MFPAVFQNQRVATASLIQESIATAPISEMLPGNAPHTAPIIPREQSHAQTACSILQAAVILQTSAATGLLIRGKSATSATSATEVQAARIFQTSLPLERLAAQDARSAPQPA